MKYISTRSKSEPVTLSEAICNGMAPDGGLYLPEKMPKYNLVEFLDLKNLDQIAFQFLSPFFSGDPLAHCLSDICQKAFDFPVDINKVGGHKFLELFHGPTASFKDVGAQFLAHCLNHMQREFTILVATSGDTGGAVASAFHEMDSINVCVLYPKGMVSANQEQQLTCWGDNVQSLRVRGDFDACQKMVKGAFNNSDFEEFNLTSANSINIGRLLPQSVYYVMTSMSHYREYGEKADFIIPTGNMGNVFACILARELGFPIKNIIMACNSNKVIPEFLKKGVFKPKTTKKTLANAMDVGNPSNMERYQQFPKINDISAYSVKDKDIKKAIKKHFLQNNHHICPHTATALHIANKQKLGNAYIVATADPAKFSTIIKEITGAQPVIPPQLQSIRELASEFKEIDATLDDLKNQLKGKN